MEPDSTDPADASDEVIAAGPCIEL